MPSKLSVGILFSGRGSNLQALIKQQERYGYQVIQALSNRTNAPGLTLAQKANVATECVEQSHYPNQALFEQALLKAIDPDCELLLLAGFMRILSASFLKQLPCPLLNIHPSLLPCFKGLDTHQRALNAGVQKHGCSVHIVTEVLDSGAVLAQSQLPVQPTDTQAQLAERVLKLEHTLYPWVVGAIASNRLKLNKTRATLDGQLLGTQGYQLTNGTDLTDAP